MTKMAFSLALITILNVSSKAWAGQGEANKFIDNQSVKIGNQEWMTENLQVITFRNGDTIPEVKSPEEWLEAGMNNQPVWCYYNNDPENGEKYGKMYNWYAVNDPRGLAPEGWHIPSDAEWNELVAFLGGNREAGNKMKSTTGWNEEGNGNNETEFSAFPGGYRNSPGEFLTLGSTGYWWSSTEDKNEFIAYSRYIIYTSTFLFRNFTNKRFGLYVRCLKD
jgi:uncharacterized protein (TIGR02145 family)